MASVSAEFDDVTEFSGHRLFNQPFDQMLLVVEKTSLARHDWGPQPFFTHCAKRTLRKIFSLLVNLNVIAFLFDYLASLRYTASVVSHFLKIKNQL